MNHLQSVSPIPKIYNFHVIEILPLLSKGQNVLPFYK